MQGRGVYKAHSLFLATTIIACGERGSVSEGFRVFLKHPVYCLCRKWETVEYVKSYPTLSL